MQRTFLNLLSVLFVLTVTGGGYLDLQASENQSLLTQNQATGRVTGSVIDENGIPVLGASIVVVGTTNGVIADIDGKFVLNNVPPTATLQISSIGYVTQNVAVNNRTDITIVLVEDTALLDEVVVVGYGTTSKRKTTSAVSQVKAEEIANVPVPNITQALAGRAPGLIVQQSGGGVNTKASISIRGGGTPLYVIDNVICEPRDFENLNVEDIESMSVLKDASATAIYGARAANGIIMVTTKRGKGGKVNVNYDFNYTLSQPAELQKKLDSFSALSYINRGYEYDGGGEYYAYSKEELELYRNGSDPFGHPNTDWQAITMRTFAPESRHNLSLTGGSEDLNVYAGIGYYDQGSIYRTNSNNMQRYNFRTNLEANIRQIGLKIGAGVDAYMVDYMEPNSGQGRGYYYVWSHIQNKRPTEPAYNPFGQIFGGTTDNPLVDISDQGGYFKQTQTSVRGNMNLEWALPWVSGLTIKALGSYTLANDRDKSWTKNPPRYDAEGNLYSANQPTLTKNTYFHSNFNTQLLADYSRTFQEVHTVGVTAGIEASGQNIDNLSASRNSYVFDIIDQLNAGPTEGQSNRATEGIGYRRASFVGRVKYDYAAKYMVEANVRYDGSDNFPRGNRWGAFFSGSAAWSVSSEKFWKDWGADRVFEQLKFRASYGEIGMEDISRYYYVSSYGHDSRGIYVGGKWMDTFWEGNLYSPDMTWYTTRDFDLGLDFASLNGRLSGSLDYFAKVTTGYLAPSSISYSAPLGQTLPYVKSNGESIRRGFEVALQWKDSFGDFSYGVSANMTYYDTRWNIHPTESETALKNPYKRTTQAGNFYGALYKNLGYYTDYKDVLNSPQRDNSAYLMAGDLKYYDFNGDGKIDADDQYNMGKGGSPQANFGVNFDLGYKGWSLNMLWQGASNYNLYVNEILMGGNSNYLPVIYEFQTDIWAPDNRDALYPRQHYSGGANGSNNFVGSDFWLVDARYLRLKNLSLGYDLKHSVLKNVSWLSQCNLSLAGYNLLTFSPAKKWGFDPESGRSDGYTYPISRVYTFSLRIGF